MFGDIETKETEKPQAFKSSAASHNPITQTEDADDFNACVRNQIRENDKGNDRKRTATTKYNQRKQREEAIHLFLVSSL